MLDHKNTTISEKPHRSFSQPVNSQRSPLAKVYAIAEAAYYRDLAQRQARVIASLAFDGLTVRLEQVNGRAVARVIVAMKRETKAAA